MDNRSLQEVDRVEVLTLMDNYVDVLLTSTDVVERPPLGKDGKIPADNLVAEHGLSLLITLYKNDETHTVLFDTGHSSVGVLHNIALLEIDPTDIEALVLSHGHMDHTATLYPLLDRIPGPVPLVVHPDAFLSPRYLALDDGRKLLFPQTLKRPELEKRKVEVLESTEPTLIAGNTALVTGEVERTTPFEKGLPNAFLERNGAIEKDPILDDQAIVIKLKGKGLVVISGCAHAGIMNTLLYAMKLTGVSQIHAVLGGFHLSGAFFEPIIEDTIEELKKLAPEILVPMHCTGWKAIHRFSEEFPESFILNSVGSRFTIS
ncbi:MAG: MBL fold metallo-hydrolase [Desulfatiglandaceae bacterium]|jgi:7,8-dihydropterin-6-yl-methyl-4-(beta-D-ribofuranosyl)aminobenzene 5'-phosphate synthase